MTQAAIEELLAFCRRHPIENADAERFLCHLSNVPASLVDLRDIGWLGVILDRVPDSSGARPFEWIAGQGQHLPPAVVPVAIGAIRERARGLGIACVHVLMNGAWGDAAGALMAASASPCYHDWDMVHPDGDWGRDLPLPTGCRWVDPIGGLEHAYIAVLQACFDSLPGAYVPSEDELLRTLRDPSTRARALIDNDKRIRALMRCRPEKRYIHAIARDPAFGGMGLGQMALDEARRVLGRGEIRLSTVRENARAVALYQRLGFQIEREITTWALPVAS